MDVKNFFCLFFNSIILFIFLTYNRIETNKVIYRALCAYSMHSANNLMNDYLRNYVVFQRKVNISKVRRAETLVGERCADICELCC